MSDRHDSDSWATRCHRAQWAEGGNWRQPAPKRSAETGYSRGWWVAMAVCAVAALVLTVAPPAEAGTVGLHVGSWHSEPGYNDRNPGLMYRSDEGWTGGAYCNSESRSERFPDAKRCRVSTYAGKTWEAQVTDGVKVALTAGLITGYQRAAVMPMAIPSALFGDHIRLLYAPKIEPKGAQVISLMLEFKQ